MDPPSGWSKFEKINVFRTLENLSLKSQSLAKIAQKSAKLSQKFGHPWDTPRNRLRDLNPGPAGVVQLILFS